MKRFALRVLVARYVLPINEVDGPKTCQQAGRIVPTSRTAKRPITILKLVQLVRPLQSLLPAGKESSPDIAPTGFEFPAM